MERAGEAPDATAVVRRAPSTAPSARVSIWESVRACGVWSKEVDKAELRRQVVMPLYLRRAVAAAVKAKDEAAGVAAAAADDQAGEDADGPAVAPVVVFVNSRSGGRHGPELKVRLHELITEEQVCDAMENLSTLVQLCLPQFCSSFFLPPNRSFAFAFFDVALSVAWCLSLQVIARDTPVEFHSDFDLGDVFYLNSLG